MGRVRQKASLIHEKLKKAKPLDLVQFNVKLPAYLLSDIKTYGDAPGVFRNALEMANKTKFTNLLMEDVSNIRSRIELLEIWKENNRDEMDREHLQLIEIYKDVYFKLKEAKVLRRKRKS